MGNQSQLRRGGGLCAGLRHRPGGAQIFLGLIGALQPAMAFLVLDGLGPPGVALAFAALQKLPVNRAQDRAVGCVDRDHGVQVKAAAALLVERMTVVSWIAST